MRFAFRLETGAFRTVDALHRAAFSHLAARTRGGRVRRFSGPRIRQVPTSSATLLFTDIEGSTRLWEREAEKMSRALVEHDALSGQAVETHRGSVVKLTPVERGDLAKSVRMSRRRFIVLLPGALTVHAGVIAAQQPARTHRIGFLGSESASEFASRVDALRAGLRDLGYTEGKNIVFEFRWANGDAQKLPALAAELVRMRVDVLVTHAVLGTRAAMQATKTIPIVVAIVADAILSGLVESLARPGGNVTGSTILTPEVGIKRLSLLKEAVPRASRVAILSRRDRPDNDPIFEAMKAATGSMKLSLKSFEVTGPSDFANAFAAMKDGGVNALAVRDDPLLILHSAAIAEMAAKQRLPSVGATDFAEAGGMMGYGVDALEIFRHAAVFIDKVLKGARPGDLPIEQATKFHLVVNLKTVAALGLTIPQPVLVRADQLIQ